MTETDAKRFEHGPHCRTHLAALMPNYGADCTCGGGWTPDRQLSALIERVLWHELADLGHSEETERIAKCLVDSGYVVAAPGTLAAAAAEHAASPGEQ